MTALNRLPHALWERVRPFPSPDYMPDTPKIGGTGSLDPQLLADHIARDKKWRDGAVQWVLLRAIGEPVISGDVQPDTLSAAIDRLQRRFP